MNATSPAGSERDERGRSSVPSGWRVRLRYRDIILEQGATKDASQLVEEFLGRPYTLDAYRKWLQGGAPKAE